MKKDVFASVRRALLSAAFLPLLWQWHGLSAQNVIGGETGDASALLELQSSSAGLLLPRMTTAERSAIVDPAAGLMVFNTTRVCVEINLGSSSSPDWTCLATYAGEVDELNCSQTEQNGRLMEGEAASDVTLLVFYLGGNRGLYDGLQLQSTGVTGLTATLLPGAFDSGDGSIDLLISGTPVGYGAANFELSIGGQSCTVSCTVVPAGSCGAYVSFGEWKQFMCHNLGANTNADPLTPSWELTGNYYQWGRNPSCFGKDGIDEANPCSSPVYGAAGPWGNMTANDNAGSISGWSTTNAPNNALSDFSKTANDPCPAGYRIPTKNQWEGVRNTSLNTRTMVGTWAAGTTNYLSGVRFGGNFLFLPTTGQRGNSTGSLGFRNSYGYYWSSTVGAASDAAWLLIFYTTPSATVNTSAGNRTSGISVRCIVE